eukprot:349830-Chlamydomonas_euryale.AAC.1
MHRAGERARRARRESPRGAAARGAGAVDECGRGTVTLSNVAVHNTLLTEAICAQERSPPPSPPNCILVPANAGFEDRLDALSEARGELFELGARRVAAKLHVPFRNILRSRLSRSPRRGTFQARATRCACAASLPAPTPLTARSRGCEIWGGWRV